MGGTQLQKIRYISTCLGKYASLPKRTTNLQLIFLSHKKNHNGSMLQFAWAELFFKSWGIRGVNDLSFLIAFFSVEKVNEWIWPLSIYNKFLEVQFYLLVMLALANLRWSGCTVLTCYKGILFCSWKIVQSFSFFSDSIKFLNFNIFKTTQSSRPELLISNPSNTVPAGSNSIPNGALFPPNLAVGKSTAQATTSRAGVPTTSTRSVNSVVNTLAALTQLWIPK